MNTTQQRDLHFMMRDEWRDWLQHNHKHAKEAWVILFKKNAANHGLRYVEAIEEAICFGWIDSLMNTVDANTFRQRFSPRRVISNWSKANKERALRLIAQQKMTAAGYEAIENAKRTGKWQQAYTSQTCPETPVDLEHALQTTPKADHNFRMFSNSTKLMYIHWIQTAKKPETRAKRIKEVIARSTKNIKPK
jgi:uncharacterized protein YdeI (YjbR/CyaY-like superfamily)